MGNPDFTTYVKSLTSRAGVYRMYDAEGKVIYVGKAKNLKSRVSSYFRTAQDSPKTRALVRQIAAIEVTVTETEVDALLLESNLIKEFRPKYNVVFRDDKSYPYLYLSSDQNFPRLDYYRGIRKRKGRYFGPYPNAVAAKRTLNLVQKLFKLRQCNNAFFNNRQRPCLQYQIKRCSAPCVGYIEKKDYAKDIELAVLFLQGENQLVIENLTSPMQQAAEMLEFEKAAQYRDQITMLRQLQQSRHIITASGEADIIACAVRDEQACIQMFFIRGGHNLGNKTYYPKIQAGEEPATIIESFIQQFYISSDSEQQIPDELYVNHLPNGHRLLEDALSIKKQKKIRIRDSIRGDKGKWIRMAEENARLSLEQRYTQGLASQKRFTQLTQFLKSRIPIQRVECFDISHIAGDNTVASCVVFGLEGPIKSAYRRFNIENITRGDDYAAMSQVITRRYAKIQSGEATLPELILIDGGKGQVSHAKAALQLLQLENQVTLLGISKGPSRKPGMETLVLSDGSRQIPLQDDSGMLHLLQEIRDEAHRFAVTGHRQRRKKKQTQSMLDHIEGIGTKRRQNLIVHFGGIQGITEARPEELAKVAGINKNLAQKIYDSLHS